MKPGESFIEQPVRSLQTMLRIIARDDGNLPTVIPDGIYGPSTMIAVTAFQRREGIPLTGIVDEHTWNQIVEAHEDALLRVGKATPIEILLEPNQVILPGECNPHIYLLQGILAQLSHDHGQIRHPELTGVLDSETSEALRAFQILADLPPTGSLDRITWHHLANQFALNVSHNAELGKIVNNL